MLSARQFSQAIPKAPKQTPKSAIADTPTPTIVGPPTPVAGTDDTLTMSDMLKKVMAALEAYAAGEDVELPPKARRPLPEDAINSQLAVANFAVLVKRLMLGISLRKPLLLSGAFVVYWLKQPRIAAYCGLKRPIQSTTAADCLSMLREVGVIEKVDQVKTHRGRIAYLYELVPVDAEVVRDSGQQPHASLVDDGLVFGAEFEGTVRPRAAARDVAAGDGGFHA